MRRAISVFLAVPLVGLVGLLAQERPDESVFWKIRQEGTSRSQILPTLHVLTDVYGPRLTGSPNLKGAGEWALEQMKAWGLKNGHLEPWDFGHPGWLNERFTAHITSPVRDALVAEVLAWTPGTNGVARGAAIQITLPLRPTQAELTAFLDTLKPAVKGKMILVGPHQQLLVTFNPVPLRREDSDVIAQLNATPQAPGGPPPAAQAPPLQAPPLQAPPSQAPPSQTPRPLTGVQIDEHVNRFLLANGALVRINDAGRDHGQIRAFDNRTHDISTAPPTVVMRNEDYGRISRLLADKRAVELEFEIVNRTYPEGRTSYNVIAEIPGSDKADEVVMLGGHLDSWHAGTGATDNGIGSAVMMEAARIIAAIGVKPRRTIRVALWSGEEQGLLGSQAYVKEHFGTFEAQKPEYARFAGYFNIDSGTGRARGLTVFGPPAAATVLREATVSFKDLGLLGATTTRTRATGGTDSTSFNAAGLPGINALQDPIQYQTSTWHTNLDTYERIVEDDVKKSAIVIAAAVYHVAMRDELLPRFSKEEMPRPPAPPPPPQTPAPSSGAAPSRTN
ncbi:MAG TPA: M20/M25/M40 family metallo-hydrolase [Vicinamibacterales bacterium]|nr:M20/M25/M40 family metallo-hydrolase [Vicinamibacterales bacterium]